jgi:hypothetical protein
MASEDKQEYLKILNELAAKLSALTERRTELQIELGELNNQIVIVGRTLDAMSPLMGFPNDKNDLGTLGMTDAIRQVLASVKERLSASQVKEELARKGFDLSGYGNPMSSIYKVLSRLKDKDEVIAVQEGWNVFFTWKRRKPNIKITDKVPVILVEDEMKDRR